MTKVALNVPDKKLDIFLENAAEAAICPVCGKLDMRPDFVRVGSMIEQAYAARSDARRRRLIQPGSFEGPAAA